MTYIFFGAKAVTCTNTDLWQSHQPEQIHITEMFSVLKI